MGTSYNSHAGIGIVLQEDDERFQKIRDGFLEKYSEEFPGDKFNFIDCFDDKNIRVHQGGNFYCDDSFDHMFVCRGTSLQEQLNNIPNFLESINKYFPLTKEELNIVSIYQVM